MEQRVRLLRVSLVHLPGPSRPVRVDRDPRTSAMSGEPTDSRPEELPEPDDKGFSEPDDYKPKQLSVHDEHLCAVQLVLQLPSLSAPPSHLASQPIELRLRLKQLIVPMLHHPSPKELSQMRLRLDRLQLLVHALWRCEFLPLQPVLPRELPAHRVVPRPQPLRGRHLLPQPDRCSLH